MASSTAVAQRTAVASDLLKFWRSLIDKEQLRINGYTLENKFFLASKASEVRSLPHHPGHSKLIGTLLRPRLKHIQPEPNFLGGACETCSLLEWLLSVEIAVG